MLVVKHLDS